MKKFNKKTASKFCEATFLFFSSQGKFSVAQVLMHNKQRAKLRAAHTEHHPTIKDFPNFFVAAFNSLSANSELVEGELESLIPRIAENLTAHIGTGHWIVKVGSSQPASLSAVDAFEFSYVLKTLPTGFDIWNAINQPFIPSESPRYCHAEAIPCDEVSAANDSEYEEGNAA